MRKIARYLVCFFIVLCFSCKAYEPCCEPSYDDYPCLCCCPFGIKIKGGVAPTWFHNNVTGVAVGFADIEPSHRFSDIFDLPVTGGAEVFYACNPCLEFFFEGNYTFALGNTLNSTLVNAVEPGEVFDASEEFSNFRQIDVFVGARGFFYPRCWCKSRFFYGLKVGYMHRNPVTRILRLSLGDLPGPSFTHHYFASTNTIAVGGQLGFNYCIYDCLELGLVVEGIVSGAMRHFVGSDSLIESPVDFTITNTGLVYSVPVKLELKFHW